MPALAALDDLALRALIPAGALAHSLAIACSPGAPRGRASCRAARSKRVAAHGPTVRSVRAPTPTRRRAQDLDRLRKHLSRSSSPPAVAASWLAGPTPKTSSDVPTVEAPTTRSSPRRLHALQRRAERRERARGRGDRIAGFASTTGRSISLKFALEARPEERRRRRRPRAHVARLPACPSSRCRTRRAPSISRRVRRSAQHARHRALRARQSVDAALRAVRRSARSRSARGLRARQHVSYVSFVQGDHVQARAGCTAALRTMPTLDAAKQTLDALAAARR